MDLFCKVYVPSIFVNAFFPLQTNWTHKSDYILPPTGQHLNKPGVFGFLSYCTGIIIGPYKSIGTFLRWAGEAIKKGGNRALNRWRHDSCSNLVSAPRP